MATPKDTLPLPPWPSHYNVTGYSSNTYTQSYYSEQTTYYAAATAIETSGCECVMVVKMRDGTEKRFAGFISNVTIDQNHYGGMPIQNFTVRAEEAQEPEVKPKKEEVKASHNGKRVMDI